MTASLMPDRVASPGLLGCSTSGSTKSRSSHYSDDLARVAGVPAVKVSTVPTALLRLAGLFQPVIREFKETEYQRERPYQLDDTAARETFGLEPTPWDEILTGMVEHYRASRGIAA